ncbi:hypothetical protein J4466_02410 [Candidatus Pacearchaeota archaeon]|nr:hypothetical protein [Candidatus Pacearchaeota archaeon]
MPLLERVRQMKQSGMNENEIVKGLQEQGISPREINDAVAQSRIKDVISNQPISGIPSQNTMQESSYPGTEEADGYSIEGMQPSLINQQEQAPNIPIYAEELGQYPQPQQYPGYEEYSQEQTSYPQQTQEGQDYQSYYGAGYGSSTETISEIASQMIDEKLSKTNKILSNLTEFKIILDAKVDKIDQRLQRIELIIDQLQTNLIRKSSSQIQDIEDIKNEMRGMQEGFSKVLNPLTDNIREIERIKSRTEKSGISKPIKQIKSKIKKK